MDMKKKGPFALSILTLDTHYDNELQPGAKKKYAGDMRDIIRHQSKIIDNFIKWVLDSEFGDNTVIVLLGDHYMMTNRIGNVSLNDNSRRIFNVILNSKAKNTIPKQRKAAVFDFAPTVLEAMGFEWPLHSLGIGRSLFQNNPTILELHGLDFYNKEAMKRSKKYMKLVK